MFACNSSLSNMIVTNKNIIEVFKKALKKLNAVEIGSIGNCAVHKRRKAVGYLYGKKACLNCVAKVVNPLYAPFKKDKGKDKTRKNLIGI